MRIANVLRRFSFDEWGGTETVVWNTARCLAAHGCVPDIVCTSALSATSAEVVAGIDIRRFPYFYPYFPLSRTNRIRLDKKGGNPYSFSMMRYLGHQRYDIIHCHTMARLAEMVKKVSLKTSVPYVVSFHGGCFDVPKEEIKAMKQPVRHALNYGKFWDIALGFDNTFIAGADGIICVGYNEYELTRERFPEKAVIHIPNGVDFERYRVRPRFDFREKYRIPATSKVALCVSRVDYQKNQKRLVDFIGEALSAGEDIHGVIIGPVTSDRYGCELRRLVSAGQLDNRITIIEGLPPGSEELIAAYHSADVFVLPSLHEPFGIVVLEAWAAGVPIIAAKVGGLKNLLDSGNDGIFFDPESTSSLMQAYRQITENPALRQRLIAHGEQKVKTFYSWDKITDKLYDFYRKVIDEHATQKN